MSALKLLAAVAFAFLSSAPVAGALPEIVPVRPQSGSGTVAIADDIELPPIAPDRFYSIEFWDFDEDRPGKRPETTTLLELGPGVHRFPVMRYFSPGAKYEWRAIVRAREESQATLASMKKAGVIEVGVVVATPGRIEIVEPLDGSRPRMANGDYLVAWKQIPGAAKYVLMTCIDKKKLAVDGCPEANAGSMVFGPIQFADLRRNGVPDANPFRYVAADRGNVVSLYVMALDAAGKPIAYSQEVAFEAQRDTFAKLNEMGLSLLGTLDPGMDDAENYASLGYSRGTDKDGDYRYWHSQFALLWKSDLGPSTPLGYMQWTASVAANLNSRGANRSDDSITVRAGLVDYFSTRQARGSKAPDAPLSGGFGARIAANLKYETSRSTADQKRTEKTLGEVRVNPLFGGLSDVFDLFGERDYTGRYPSGVTQVKISPTLGFDRGRTDTVGASEEVGRNLLRYIGQLRIEVASTFLATKAGSLILFADRTWYHLPWEEKDRNRAYLASGIDVPIAPGAAFTMRYNVGRSAPLFIFERAFDVGIGLKF